MRNAQIKALNDLAAYFRAKKRRECAACGGLFKANARRVFCDRCDLLAYQIRADAVAAVGRAVAAGVMPPARLFGCSDCPRPAEEYDHRHYGAPLAVVPVCVSCNKRRGRALDLIGLVAARVGVTVCAEGKCGSTVRNTEAHYHPKLGVHYCGRSAEWTNERKRSTILVPPGHPEWRSP